MGPFPVCKRLVAAAISVIYSVGGFSPPATGQINLPAHFDFGPTHQIKKTGYIPIGPETEFDKAEGYGLLSRPDSAFLLPYDPLLDEVHCDGLADEEAIRFRVDLPPGCYWLQLSLAGGRFNEWRGEIRANQKFLANTLHQFRLDFEEDNPPRFWSILRKIEVDNGSLILEVRSKNQTTTLTGLSVFRDAIGPLRWRNGRVVAIAPLHAPNAELALALINKGRPEEAHRIIDAIPEPQFAFEKALLLLALAGRLEVTQPRPLVEWAASLLRAAMREGQTDAAPLNLHLAELYLQADNFFKMAGWDWAKKRFGGGIFTFSNRCGSNLQKLVQVSEHPFYPQALWLLGRLAFWDWVEQHGAQQKAYADSCFAVLRLHYPDHRLLRMYMGESIPWQKDRQIADTDAPEWAALASAALDGLLEVIHYWVDFRQADNGEFGGKYDDDVEMLRWWPVARLAADDPKTLQGLQRLVDGIWNSGWIVNGFSRKIRDVEHAAEPAADTQPMMIGLDYGNPIYVERCMQSVKLMRDLWTGITPRGHRHFKTSWYSATELDLRPPRDCDVPMNARTVQMARWLAWYNRHPAAMQFLREWTDGWLEDCLRTDKGKPYGIVPAAIRFMDDAIGGHANNWHHPGMFWNYYNFRGGARMMQQFLSMYALTGQTRYLEPIELALELVAKYEGRDLQNAPVGSEAWVARILRHSGKFAKTVEQWRLLTGNSKFDDLLTRIGSDYLKFRLSGNPKHLIDGCRKIVEGTYYNRELITTEAYFTDRIYIGSVHQNQSWGASHLESMYTGGTLMQGFYPFYAVSWQGLGADFAAAVLEADQRRLRILAYNLSEQEKSGSLFFWRLEPGQYEFLQGADENEDGKIDRVTTRHAFHIRGRSSRHSIRLPARTLQLIEVRQVHADGVMPPAMPDLAITGREIRVRSDSRDGKLKITVPVHNIGIAPAENINIVVRAIGGRSNVLARTNLARLDAPLDLEPAIAEVQLRVGLSDLPPEQIMIEVDPEDRIAEITEVNNRVAVAVYR